MYEIHIEIKKKYGLQINLFLAGEINFTNLSGQNSQVS